MKKVFLYISISTFLFTSFSCSDDDSGELNNPLEETKQYFPMEIGNYWVYNSYRISPDGTENMGRNDTIKITREKTIRNKTYYCRYSTLSNQETFIADSAGYLVDDRGNILFSNINFTDVLSVRQQKRGLEPDSPLLFETTGKMEKIDQTVTVPAGNFDAVLNFSNIVTVYDENSPWFGKDDKLKQYYVKNVGMILKTNHYVFSPDLLEYRLVKYHIDGKTFPE